MDTRTELWEWLDLGDKSRIYPMGRIGGGWIIGGLEPFQAKKLVEFHNRSIEKTKRQPKLCG